ncbi:MAG: M28 family peptidase, partial [Catalinimonas sp.]
TNTTQPADPRGLWATKLKTAREKGAAAVLAVRHPDDEAFEAILETYGEYLSEDRMSFTGPDSLTPFAVVTVRPSLGAKLAGLTKRNYQRLNLPMRPEQRQALMRKSRPAQVRLQADRDVSPFTTENVLGVIEGGEHPDEVVVITAHYDHLGRRGNVIYNGADDDGSGTAAVMEMAEAFAAAAADTQQPPPRRSILFMAVTGEEKGLLGSEHYAQFPVFPIEAHVANLNIDMIGRTDPAHEGDDDYLYLIGSDRLSAELHELSEEVNRTYGDLDFDYTYNAPDDPNRFYYRSDHYNFARRGVPVIFYFSGVHEDYHRPTDTVEKINFARAERITRLVFYTAWELANRPERVKVD